MDYGYNRKRGYDDMGMGGGQGGFGGGGFGYNGYTTSRDRITCPETRKQVYMQMSKEGTRREKRRRDADDFDPEAKIMRKLFVKNLPSTATEVKVREYFEKFGQVEQCDVVMKPNGECKGFGFLVFERSEGVDAVQAARPHKFGETDKTVTLTTKRASLIEDKLTDNLTETKIFIGSPNSFTFRSGTGGLDDSISDDDLKEYFGQFGTVTEVLQLFHADSGRKKGVGFITFDDEDPVDKIVLIGAHMIKGRALEAQKALSEKKMNEIRSGVEEEEVKKPTDPTDKCMRKLFIRKLSKETTEASLKEYFEKFGEVVDCKIPTDRKHGGKATYGFLTFKTLEEADEV